MGIKCQHVLNLLKNEKKISAAKIAHYANPEARRRTGEAIRLAKTDPIKLENHRLAQQRRYANFAERQKAHESNTQKKTSSTIYVNW